MNQFLVFGQWITVFIACTFILGLEGFFFRLDKGLSYRDIDFDLDDDTGVNSFRDRFQIISGLAKLEKEIEGTGCVVCTLLNNRNY